MQGHSELLSINTMPNSVYDPHTCLRTTIAAAEACKFPVEKIMFEMTEHEAINNFDHFISIVKTYKSMGFITAIDDFGAGYAGMNLLATFQPDYIKLDMDLIRGIDRNRAKQVIVRGILQIAEDLGIKPICEGIETEAEYETLREFGVALMQGYYFARPSVEAFPAADWHQGKEGLSQTG